MNFPNMPQIPQLPITPFAPRVSPRRTRSPRRSRSPRRTTRRSHRHSHRHSHRRTERVIIIDNRTSAQRRVDQENRRLEEQRIRSQYAATQAGFFYEFLRWLFGGRKRN